MKARLILQQEAEQLQQQLNGLGAEYATMGARLDQMERDLVVARGVWAVKKEELGRAMNAVSERLAGLHGVISKLPLHDDVPAPTEPAND